MNFHNFMKKINFSLYVKYLFVGITTGLANGLFGSGGGMIAVPALNIIVKMEEHKSHATAISIILPLTLVSSFIYVKGGYMDFDTAFKVIPGGLVGGYLGAKFLKACPTKWLHKIFGIFIIAGAIKMIIG